MSHSQTNPAYLPPGADINMPAASGDHRAPSGFLLVDKPRGMTSQQVVSRIRRRLGIKKVGHAGTLDPLATGLLMVGIGKATRILTYLVGADKSYIATIRIGIGTLSDDAEGDVTSSPGWSPDSPAEAAELIDAQLNKFIGTIEQVPSSISAKKIDGKRAYDLIREGHEVDLPPKTVTITRCERLAAPTLSTTDDGTPVVDVSLVVDCSSGTYIRAIARDLGQALGCAAHVTALRRTHTSSFSVDMAVDLPQIADKGPQLVINPVAITRRLMPTLEVDQQQALSLSHGQAIATPPAIPSAATCALVLVNGPEPKATADDCRKLLVAIGQLSSDSIKPVTVFVDAAQITAHMDDHAKMEEPS